MAPCADYAVPAGYSGRSEDLANAVADLRSQFGDDSYLIARCATRLSSSGGGEDLDVPVGSVHPDPLPILDQLRGVFYPTTVGRPYSRAITAPWVIRPPTSVTRPVIDEEGDQLGSV